MGGLIALESVGESRVSGHKSDELGVQRGLL